MKDGTDRSGVRLADGEHLRSMGMRTMTGKPDAAPITQPWQHQTEPASSAGESASTGGSFPQSLPALRQCGGDVGAAANGTHRSG
jgi:hypothetical protein